MLERADRVGGVLGTELHQGSLLERGPDTLVTHKPAAVELCRQLGLGPRLVFPPAGRSEILSAGRLRPIPEGFALLAPTRRWPLLGSSLLTWSGKLRALQEPWVPTAGASAETDESVASFVRRRIGSELLERIVEPIVGAIYMADVEHLSLASTFPRFLALEREFGSVTRGLRQPRPAGSAATATLSGGLAQIVEALVARLPEGVLRLRTGVERVTREGRDFVLRLDGGRSLTAAAVLMATPAPATAVMLCDLDATLAAHLREFTYASCATVHLAWPRATVAMPRSHGFFVPRSAVPGLVAAGFVSVKFPDRVPTDQFVVRAFLGGALSPEVAELGEADLVEAARRTLAPLLGVRQPPTWTRVHRHLGSMPQFALGHRGRVARVRARLAECPELVGLDFTGGPVGAYGIPDSIAAAQDAAARVLDKVRG
mgnify:CR=1 FL=1